MLPPCRFLQDQKAADWRAQHLARSWMRRDVALPNALPPGRGTDEDYVIRPFANPAFLPAILNGGMLLTVLLRHRPLGRWWIDPLDPAYKYVLMGNSSIPQV